MIKLNDMLEINAYSQLVITRTDEDAPPLATIPEDSYRYIVKGFRVLDNVLYLFVEKMGESKIYRIK